MEWNNKKEWLEYESIKHPIYEHFDTREFFDEDYEWVASNTDGYDFKGLKDYGYIYHWHTHEGEKEYILRVPIARFKELFTGAFKSGIEKDLGQAEFAASFFRIYPIGETLKTYARLRVDLERLGNRLDNMDMFIAATALEHHLTLVTGNTRHFARIPSLVLEDWIER